MQIEYTQKLYFGKFYYKISVEVSGESTSWWSPPKEITPVLTWCAVNLNSLDYKLTKFRQHHDPGQRQAVWHACIYCASADLRDQVLKQFGAQVVYVCQPLDDAHRMNLSVKNIISVRKDLIYKKFSHVIYFKYERTGKLYKWLKDYFRDNPKVRVAGSLWWCKVYMQDDVDVMSIQLSWPDHIDYLKTVRLIQEAA